ncbi:hypothetical protein SAMN05661012_01240 [Chitinophaga sancti]|uniref:Uncharacterized protein n=1 Tax=Chitinophaga sancti TaxID=1004 RepID=A0A1K1NEE5_9BACT|nr:hypothetical protein SAMN05661012_01240 [Chitinophaga sancti]
MRHPGPCADVEWGNQRRGQEMIHKVKVNRREQKKLKKYRAFFITDSSRPHVIRFCTTEWGQGWVISIKNLHYRLKILDTLHKNIAAIVEK